MPKLTINDHLVEVPENATVLQACALAGVEIPRFCYHERLSIAGNCRMCLVEVEKAPKLVASCAMPAQEGMVVKTHSPRVHAARKGVLEFLLINHPLDCPICDQGGECDLQDQAFFYGYGQSAYQEEKRAVGEKELGPLIKTAMTRCIHCTRCIRFAQEVAGVPELGLVSRGEKMEVTNYVGRAISSELSGNLVDVCPVGALTSKPYAFLARPWELSHTDSVDVLDAVGSNIRIDTRSNQILRILPRLNEEINEEWISDKTRYAHDGLRYQRLDQPYQKENGHFVPISWEAALETVARRVLVTAPQKMAALIGDLVDAETLFVFKAWMQALGVEAIESRQNGALVHPSLGVGSYLFNDGFAGLEKADALLFVGCDLRKEAAVLQAKVRKRFAQGGLSVASIGLKTDWNFPVAHLGDDGSTFLNFETHAFAKSFSNARFPMIVMGQSAWVREDAPALLQWCLDKLRAAGALRADWNGFNCLHTAASRVAALALGCVSSSSPSAFYRRIASEGVDLLYLLGADEWKGPIAEGTYVIYQGHHADKGAQRADLLLPGCAYTEKSGSYINSEGRLQRSMPALAPLGHAKEDWRIIRALSERTQTLLPFDTLEEVRAALAEAGPLFQQEAVLPKILRSFTEAKTTLPDPSAFQPAIAHFYATDPISRHSLVMASCRSFFDSSYAMQSGEVNHA